MSMIMIWKVITYISILDVVLSVPIDPSLQKRANELVLSVGTSYISSGIRGYVQPNDHSILNGAQRSTSWPAELPRSYALKKFDLPPVQYEEDKKASRSNSQSSPSEKVSKLQKTSSTIKEAIAKQRNKPQRTQSFAQGRVEDAKWEKIYFSAATGAALVAKKVFDSSKNVAKTAKEKCLDACESFKKSANFGTTSTFSKSTNLSRSQTLSGSQNLSRSQSLNKSQSLKKRRKQGRTFGKRDVILIRRANSESQGSKQDQEKQPKNEKGKRPATDSLDRISGKDFTKRRRTNEGIRIGKGEESISSLRQAIKSRRRRSTSSTLRKGEVVKKVHRLRYSTNQRRTRQLRTILAQKQPIDPPIRSARQASSRQTQTVRSQVAYQSDSSVSSALSNVGLRSLNIDDQRVLHNQDSLSNSSGSGTSSFSIDP